MIADLEAYLDQATTSELGTIILTSCRVLAESGVSDHEFLLQQQLDTAEGLEFDVVYKQINLILSPLMRQALAEFGVYMDQETPLKMLNVTMESLNQIDDWGDNEAIYALADYDEGATEAFADVIEYVSNVPSAEILEHVNDVSVDLLTRIREATSAEGDEPQPDAQNVAAARQRLRVLIPKVGLVSETSVFLKALDDGLRLGMSYNATIAPHIDALMQLKPNQLAGELVVFAAASALPLDKLEEVSNKTKELFDIPMIDSAKISRQIKQYVDEAKA